jgi:hypothetical protein
MTTLAPPPRGRSRRRPLPKPWGGSMLLTGLHRSLSDFQPVLALTILRRSAGCTQILVGVRDPDTNQTHQNVTSVPTRRLSVPLAREWRRHLRRGDGGSGDAYAGLRNEVSSLLGYKVGLADQLERGTVNFHLGTVRASQGVSVIGEAAGGAPVTENLTMFNAEVVLEIGSDRVPRSTASYSTLVWADVDAFMRMVRSRDVGALEVGLEYAFACAYGLCLQTSLSVLTDPASFGSTARGADSTSARDPVVDDTTTRDQLELF